MAEKKKGAGGKLSRSETVTVRLDPKLKFAAEMAARKQRRTLSSFIEWAVEESLSHVVLRTGPGWQEHEMLTVAGLVQQVWDPEEPDRLVNLAMHHPDLLTHDEQLVWKVIVQTRAYWKDWELENRRIPYMPAIRQDWEFIAAFAAGDIGMHLPAAGDRDERLRNGKPDPED
ncbi:hypothetical protein [Thermithiobacillus plumbiphilus]|uniref:CopG family transcriptional regulator n=1 Tax=Thermithiobacillus plumbiphilus TaxID=1729899 RepID=A0ABU9D952_9PROT